MDAKPNSMATLAMEFAPRANTIRRLPYHVCEHLRGQPGSQDTCHEDRNINLEPVKPSLSLETLMNEKPQDAPFDGMDRLVQDLLASQKDLKEERRKTGDKDAEIGRLKEEVAQLQRGDSKGCEETNELRRLLAFHIKNGEQLSRRFRDSQAVNRALEAQLQATEAALEARNKYRSSLDWAPAQEE